jgi:DDE superfamily endonuclease
MSSPLPVWSVGQQLDLLSSFESGSLPEEHLRHLATCRTWSEFDQIVLLVEQGLERWPRNNEEFPLPRRARELSTRKIVALVLMRLRRNFRFQTMSILFGVRESTLRQVVNSWLQLIAHVCYHQFVTLSRANLAKHTPTKFAEHLPGVSAMFDCTYVYINKSSLLNFQVCVCMFYNPCSSEYPALIRSYNVAPFTHTLVFSV